MPFIGIEFFVGDKPQRYDLFISALCVLCGKIACLVSRSSSFFFNSSPSENPPSVPAEVMTRCQGMMMGMGLAPIARPTALTAFGFLMRFAIQP